MGRILRHYPLEFKERLVLSILHEEKSLRALAKEHQVPPGTLKDWVNTYRSGKPFREHGGGGHSDERIRIRALERENLLLKEKLADLYLQVEQLKKVESYAPLKLDAATSVITSKNLVRFQKAVE
jgi:transposase